MGIITAPEPIDATHCLDGFDCGVSVLNEWLKRQALANEASGASRTFVVCVDRRVIGFYDLATGSVRRSEAPGRIKPHMPEPIPVMVLARLAIDLRRQGKGVGSGLLKDAMMRTITVSKLAGIRAIVVHALSEEAKDFYLRHGLQESPLNQMTLMLSLVDWSL